MAQKIEIPGVGSYPLWATEDSLRELIKVIGGSDFGKKSGGAGAATGGQDASGMLSDSLEDLSDETDKLKKNFGSLYDETGKKKLTGGIQTATLALANFSKTGLAQLAGISDLGSMAGQAGKFLQNASAAAGAFAPAVQAAGIAIEMMGHLINSYNKILGDAIDAGLGYSNSLGDAARIAGESGLGLKEFYGALKEAGQGMRALGSDGPEAAKNFAKLQTEVRNTYGTFGMSNEEMAKSSGTFVNLMAAAGLKGVDAANAAAASQGKSMNEMRKISIATGISLSKVMGSFKDLVGDPLISQSLSKFGNNTAEAAVALARGASSFEAVFGKLGKDLYKQMKEAQAAGLSIINTELGATIAPFVDVRVFEQFAKASEEGGAAMVHASQQFAKNIEPNLATLKLQAATGNTAAKQMIEMYEASKKFTSMTDDEIETLERKKRGEEMFNTIQQKMSAALEMVANKFFGLLDLIPVDLVEGLGDTFEFLADALGVVIDVLLIALKPLKIVFEVLGIAIKGVIAFFKPFIEVIKSAVAWVGEGFGSIVDTVTGWISSFGDGLTSIMSSIGQFIADGTKWLWGLITSPFTMVYDWISGWVKSIGDWFKSSWLGRKIFGDSGDSSSTTPVLASQVDGSGTTARDAQIQTQAGLQADQTKSTQQTSEDMKRLVEVNQAQAEQMERIVSNTGQTKEAVERSSTAY